MGNIIKRYLMWNNKGGVGKSTLTFHFASLYATTHPEEKVLILDLCPQSNATMMFLGGGQRGESNLIDLQQSEQPKTIVGFYSKQLEQIGSVQPSAASVSEYLHVANSYNPAIPNNIYIVPGDGNLEVVLSSMSYYANPQAMTNAWRNVLTWARNLLDLLANELEGNIVVFIDTNPSFALYTQQAVLASDEIIIPFNADDSSRTGIGALYGLIYGINIPHPVYQNYTFASLARKADLNLPKIKLLVGNRFTQFQGAARAYAGVADFIQRHAWEVYQQNQEELNLFSNSDFTPNTLSEFESQYCIDLRDFNSAGVVASNQGTPLSSLTSGRYEVYGNTTQVNPDQIEACKQALYSVVSRL